MNNQNSFKIEVNDFFQRNIYNVTSSTGYINIHEVDKIISKVSLFLNPRLPEHRPENSTVTAAIIESMSNDPEKFPLKSKGILLAYSNVTAENETGKIQISPTGDSQNEGLLDGGHNLLAAGIYILQSLDPTFDAKGITWDLLKEKWRESYFERDIISKDLLIPIEILSSPEGSGQDLERELLVDISYARNLNSQLKYTALANFSGEYDNIKEALDGSSIIQNIEWKENERFDNVRRKISVNFLLKIVFILFSVVDFPKSEKDDIPSDETAYKNDDFLASEYSKIYKKYLKDPLSLSSQDKKISDQIISVFKLLNDLLQSYDIIYSNFAEAYNRSGGKYGKLLPIRDQETNSFTPFTQKQQTGFKEPPVEFLYPIVCSAKRLIINDGGCFSWYIDPQDFFSDIDLLSQLALNIRLAYEANKDIREIAANKSVYQLSDMTVVDNLIERISDE